MRAPPRQPASPPAASPASAAAPASPSAGSLTPAELRVIAEEEALLAGVHAALGVRRTVIDDGAELGARLKELRDEALESTAKDLPTVFQEMGVVRAVLPGVVRVTVTSDGLPAAMIDLRAVRAAPRVTVPGL